MTTKPCLALALLLADTRPTIPHDQVMADMEAIIQAAERKRAAIRS
ncbi:hypothetical protein [Burkholderia gladioli]|nr:hypothetical protein [Burkholderia gladioli]